MTNDKTLSAAQRPNGEYSISTAADKSATTTTNKPTASPVVIDDRDAAGDTANTAPATTASFPVDEAAKATSAGQDEAKDEDREVAGSTMYSDWSCSTPPRMRPGIDSGMDMQGERVGRMRDDAEAGYKVRENRARRVLARMGYSLEKSPRRDARALDFGLYRIVPVDGPRSPEGYAMTLVEVEAWIDGGPPPRDVPRKKPSPTLGRDGGRAILHVGDCRDLLRRLPSNHFHCCVTSPPYFWLRDERHADQIGLEDSPDAYVATLTGVFRQVRRVLHPDGTVWIVIDDTYCTRRAIRPDGKRSVARDMASGQNSQGHWRDAAADGRTLYSSRMAKHGLKDKDRMLIPERLALVLQADGWWVRSMIVWVKPNFAPAPVGDRPVHSYEHILLLTKSPRYYFDASALRERSVDGGQRTGRDVWTIRPTSGKGDHTSTFPVELAAKCILAGSPPGSWVLDCFAGTGTTGMAALQHGRNAALIELVEAHADTIRKRLCDRLSEVKAET
jgi:site-specific DNA-methyltransferase (adenine-specific)